MHKTPFLTLILIILTAGCATPPAETTPTATPPVPTATPRPTNASATARASAPVNAPTASATATDTSTPTATMTPTATATPKPTATSTAAATPTVAPTPEPQARAQGKNINIRRGPGTGFPVAAILPDGEAAQVIARGPNGWLQITLDGKIGWVYAGVVQTLGPVAKLAMAETIPTPPTPTSTPAPSTTTLAPASPTLPPRQDAAYLTQDTQFPVRAHRFIGWGYEIVDASEHWDIILNRDVFGYALHEFYGDALYGPHPHGLRITFLDCVPKTFADGYASPCLGTTTPIPLFADSHSLTFSFGDGVGSVAAYGCAAPATNYHDPQECFIALGPLDAGYLTDVAIGAMIMADSGRMGYGDHNNPRFDQPPFTPYLGVAVRDDRLQQWRWQGPFLQIIPQQP